jgi:hypothetical protein
MRRFNIIGKLMFENGEVLDSHGGDFEDNCLLGRCDA